MKKTEHDLLDDMRYSTVKLTVERTERAWSLLSLLHRFLTYVKWILAIAFLVGFAFLCRDSG
jgi:hypothetical protein